MARVRQQAERGRTRGLLVRRALLTRHAPARSAQLAVDTTRLLHPHLRSAVLASCSTRGRGAVLTFFAARLARFAT